MKNFSLIALLLALLSYVNSVSAQTATDLGRRYGKALVAYSVSEHISMTPEFARDGRVCSMRLYPKRIDEKTNYVSSSISRLPFEELRDVLNQLVPPETRGSKKESFGQTATGGPAAWTTYPYELMTFTFIGPFGPLPYDSTVIRKGEFVFPADFSPSDVPIAKNATVDDFEARILSDIQIVTIAWSDRRCPSK